MNKVVGTSENNKHDCRTYSVEEMAHILGIGRSSAYILARESLANDGNQIIRAKRHKKSILISRKSVDEYLESFGA